jgi:Beta-ketoacyl synthase, N-terminal domain
VLCGHAASGRLSYTFGLRGSALSVDTACSSSLVAAHLTASSIWGGGCSCGFAAGAGLFLNPGTTAMFQVVSHSAHAAVAEAWQCPFALCNLRVCKHGPPSYCDGTTLVGGMPQRQCAAKCGRSVYPLMIHTFSRVREASAP